MIIEYRKIADNDSLISLMSELGYVHDQQSISVNIKEVQLRGGGIFVADVNGKIAGCVCAILDARLAAGLCGEIVSLVVASEYRGSGIGKGLVAYAERWLGTKVDKIRIRANVIRAEAQGFYQSQGYQEEKIQKLFTKKKDT
ncbi:MAG: GNAT family N-acetyltransferase [Desulfobulbaceae bacterium]|nr:GNAT family N-acetyltransferase [Desulfobulbaceae bacterium]